MATNFTNDGMAAVAALINGDGSPSAFTYVALGTDDGTLVTDNASASALGAEITTNGGSRETADTITRETTTQTNDTAKWINTWEFTGTLGIDECGIFDAASNGNMLLRHVFTSTKNVENGDSLQLTITLQVS